MCYKRIVIRARIAHGGPGTAIPSLDKTWTWISESWADGPYIVRRVSGHRLDGCPNGIRIHHPAATRLFPLVDQRTGQAGSTSSSPNIAVRSPRNRLQNRAARQIVHLPLVAIIMLYKGLMRKRSR